MMKVYRSDAVTYFLTLKAFASLATVRSKPETRICSSFPSRQTSKTLLLCAILQDNNDKAREKSAIWIFWLDNWKHAVSVRVRQDSRATFPNPPPLPPPPPRSPSICHDAVAWFSRKQKLKIGFQFSNFERYFNFRFWEREKKLRYFSFSFWISPNDENRIRLANCFGFVPRKTENWQSKRLDLYLRKLKIGNQKAIFNFCS